MSAGPRRLCSLVLALAFAASAWAETVAPFHRVNTLRRISTDPFPGTDGSQADTEVEPHVAVDPNDPAIVVAVFQQGRFTDGGSTDPGFAASHDGGRRWAPGSLPGLTVAVGGVFERASDPVAAIGPDGGVYAVTIPFSPSNGRSALAVQRSDDGGVTFASPVLLEDDGADHFNDKPWIAVDGFMASAHRGRVYTAWDRIGPGQPIVLRYSDNRGASWSGRITVSDRAGGFNIGAIPLVQPNGDLTVVYESSTPTLVDVAQTSHDGGVTFDPSVTISTVTGADPSGLRTGALPAAAVDPLTGALHVVWQDVRARSDGLNDILLTSSTNRGVTWSPAHVVHAPDTSRAFERFTPAVAAYGGFVHVTYRARPVIGGVPLPVVEMRYVGSADDGVTFGRERRLGRRGRLDFAANTDRGLFLGDYMGLAAGPVAVHAVWCLPRHGAGAPAPHEATWTARVMP